MNSHINHPIRAIATILLILLLPSLCLLVACSSDDAEPGESIDVAAVEDISVPDADPSEGSEDSAAMSPQRSGRMSDQMKAVRSEVESVVSDYDNAVAVSVVPLDGSPGFSVNGDKSFVSASMIKLLILADYLAAVEEGSVDPNAVYVRNSKDVVGGTGIIQSDAEGTTYTYDDLACHMIASSDNTATNVLIDLLGMEGINAEAASLGLGETNLRRKMMDLDSGVENHITADDAASILARIANHSLASPELCIQAESYLKGQTDNEGLAEGLPGSVEFGHKTGSLDSVRHDGGIVYSDRPYVVVVLTELDPGTANNVMSQVSGKLYEALGAGGTTK